MLRSAEYNYVLHTKSNMLDAILHELLWVHELRFEFILVVAGPQDIVLAHAPRVHFVGCFGECIVVVTLSKHL